LAANTDIQWADDTVNPTSGCDGCELWTAGVGGPCYAGAIHNRFRGGKAFPGPFEQIILHHGRMARAAARQDLAGKSRPDKPWLDGHPRTIFLGDMADVFSRAVPFDYLKTEVVDVVTGPKGARHNWMILTKRPSRMAEFARWLGAERGAGWPANLWAGTSVTARPNLSRLTQLCDVPAAVRFASLEPLTEPLSVAQWLGPAGVGMVIVGGESTQPRYPARPFDVAWARKVVAECRAAGVSAFVKQLGSSAIGQGIDGRLHDKHGGDWSEWPEDIRVRQHPGRDAA